MATCLQKTTDERVILAVLTDELQFVGLGIMCFYRAAWNADTVLR